MTRHRLPNEWEPIKDWLPVPGKARDVALTAPGRFVEAVRVINTHRAQRSFGDGRIAEEVKDLHEAWMKHADQVLSDRQIVAAIHEALAKRHPHSRTPGLPAVPAELVLRLLVLTHMRNWRYGELL